MMSNGAMVTTDIVTTLTKNVFHSFLFSLKVTFTHTTSNEKH